MMGKSKKWVWIAGAALVAIGSTGCNFVGDECTKGESHCVDDHTLRACVGNHDAIGARYHYTDIACPQSGDSYCVTPSEGGAMCALESSPNALCQSGAGGSSCNESGVVKCVQGYLTQAEQCPGQCLVGPNGEACALCDDGTSVEEPSCAGGVPGACVENTAYACSCGYRVASFACPSGTTCIVGPPNGSPSVFCALSAIPDPRCSGDYEDAYCDGSVAVSCTRGYETARAECAPQAGCKEAGNTACCY